MDLQVNTGKLIIYQRCCGYQDALLSEESHRLLEDQHEHEQHRSDW
jgi:hypothetical protein